MMEGTGSWFCGIVLPARGSAVRDARVRWLALGSLRTGVKFLAHRALPGRNHSQKKDE